MGTASDIILERLKTHPEEFVHLDGDISSGGTWSILINNASRWATPEELKSIEEGMIQARRTLADQIALQILSGEYYDPPEINLNYTHPYNQPTGNLTINTSNSSLWGGVTITDPQLENYKREMKALIELEYAKRRK